MRKKISQREAVRNRRELKALRAFVRGIEGMWPTGDFSEGVVDFSGVDKRYTAKMSGIQWGARGRVVFVVRRDNDTLKVLAIRTPEARDAE